MIRDPRFRVIVAACAAFGFGVAAWAAHAAALADDCAIPSVEGATALAAVYAAAGSVLTAIIFTALRARRERKAADPYADERGWM